MSMIHDITSTTPRYKKPTRKGRGEASKGKTSGRGDKGAKARVGKYVKRLMQPYLNGGSRLSALDSRPSVP